MFQYNTETLSFKMLCLFDDLLSAATYMMSAGVLHMDIKGDNVRFSDDGRPVLIDFGTTCEYHKTRDTVTAEVGMVGNIMHCSPELRVLLKRKQPLIFSGDKQLAFSIGVLMAECLSPDHEHPFQNYKRGEVPTNVSMDEWAAYILRVHPTVGHGIDDMLPSILRVVAEMLKEDPAVRMSTFTAADVITRMRAAAGRAQGPCPQVVAVVPVIPTDMRSSSPKPAQSPDLSSPQRLHVHGFLSPKQAVNPSKAVLVGSDLFAVPQPRSSNNRTSFSRGVRTVVTPPRERPPPLAHSPSVRQGDQPTESFIPLCEPNTERHSIAKGTLPVRVQHFFEKVKGGSWKEGQQDAVTSVAGGTDTVFVAPTGGGKTLVAIVAGLVLMDDVKNSTTLVIAPTVALSEQHVNTINATVRPGSAVFFQGTKSSEEVQTLVLDCGR